MKFLKQLYINNLFFVIILLIITLFTCSFFFDFLYNFAWNLFYVLVIFVFIDIILLFGNKTGIVAQRKTAEKLSNGDENPVEVSIIRKSAPYNGKNKNIIFCKQLKMSSLFFGML